MKPFGCPHSDCARCNGTVSRLEARIAELEAETKRIALPTLEDAYQEGWYDGRNTTSVCGHIPDWEESETKREGG
ncbi:MAG: hypothetical protein C0610_16620 [Desulfobacteraceae bacterium]|nr:MAG: hypothetical protein C0610_16620 [Desulfobacteraceae bacterium]